MRLALLVTSALLTTVSSFVIPINIAQVSNVTSGGTELDQFMQSYFVTNVTVGTPPQLFRVIVDTGSANFWIPDVTCSACKNKRLFDSKASSTFIKNGMPWANSDRFGNTSGILGADTVRFATDARDMVTVENTGVFQAAEIGEKVAALDGVDGVLGLAFQAIATANVIPPFITGFNRGHIVSPVFSIWLEEQGESSDSGTAGVIFYGGYDPVHCSSERKFQYLSVIGQFQFTTATLYINGHETAGKMQTTIVSSSPFIKMPLSSVRKVLSLLHLPADTPLPAKVKCDAVLELEIYIAFEELIISQRNLIVPNGDGTCTLAVMPADAGSWNDGLNIELGIPFLRGRCTYFDIDQQRVGFADAKSHASNK
ncbi:unnamed protein product [Heligmosomoides polygyrus]|uniref:Peptidase A1 domain-containing protein n=1 Tax=Heligmosomoides polygyrus TaxID=6339 RepID=A0A183FWM8_HELPZ|nr:unnamed protein product [Heligmosomoides polygyrus]